MLLNSFTAFTLLIFAWGSKLLKEFKCTLFDQTFMPVHTYMDNEQIVTFCLWIPVSLFHNENFFNILFVINGNFRFFKIIFFYEKCNCAIMTNTSRPKLLIFRQKTLINILLRVKKKLIFKNKWVIPLLNKNLLTVNDKMIY